MKALSIKQPWASLIAHRIKDIENRTWKTNFRGRIYIHASSKSVQGNVKQMFTLDQWNAIPVNYNNFTLFGSEWQKSSIIGEVDIIDCVQDHPSIWAESSMFGDTKIWNWVLSNPVLYDKPITNVKGALSFWNYKP